MSTEALESFDSQESTINPQEKQKEAIRQETDRLYSSLDNFSLEQINTLVDNLSANNPDFKKELTKFQDANSTKVELMLKASSNETEINQDKISNFDYFWIDTNKIQEIQNELDSLGLDINLLLEWYRKYIETNLEWLDEKIKDKVKLSILNTVLNLWTEIKDLKWDLEPWEDFKNNRWIVNEKIQDSFSFINNELLPSIEVYLKKDNFDFWYFDKDKKIEEITEMLNADVDDEWNFDEWFFSMQNVFDYESDIDRKVLEANNIQKIEGISLLSPEDIKIQEDAMISFFILIWVQIIPYLWAPISVWVDIRDIYSNEDATIELWKKLWMIDSNFKMWKEWYDNVLWWVWLWLTVIWLQWIAKWKKMTYSINSLRKIWFWRIEETLIKFWDKLWITKDRLDYVLDLFKNIFNWGDINEFRKENLSIPPNNIKSKVVLEATQLTEREKLLINEWNEIKKQIEFISRSKEELFKILNTTNWSINKKKLLEKYRELDVSYINLLKREKEIFRILDWAKIEDAKVFIEWKIWNPLLEDILTRFVDDTDHSMNITDYLKDTSKRESVIDEINNLLASWLIWNDDFISVIKSSETFNSPLLKWKNFNNSIDLSKKMELNNVQLFKWYDFNDIRDVIRLDEHIINIKLNVLNKLDSDLKNILSDANVNWIHISSRVKSKEWVIDKIKRMRGWNNWKEPRLDYVLSSVPDIIGWRIIVKDISDLEKVMIKLEEMYWEWKIFEKDNFYINEWKKYRPYRLITYTVEINNTPVEIQLVSFVQNIVADIDHNLLYKPIIKSTTEQKELVRWMTNTATANEILKLK